MQLFRLEGFAVDLTAHLRGIVAQQESRFAAASEPWLYLEDD